LRDASASGALRATVIEVTYWVLKVLLSPILLLLWRVQVEGREHLPVRGPAVLAPNHVSFLDSMFLPLVLRRRVTFVAKAEYFDSWKTAWFFRAAGQIPMRREGGSASERALAAARDVLASGGLLGMYPEGTRSPDGRLYRGHTGVARLALGCQVPLVPVGMCGTGEVQRPGSNRPRPFKRVVVRFGESMSLSRFDGNATSDPLALRALTDELMFEIRQLSGQEYVDHYAKKYVSRGAETDSVRRTRTIADADASESPPLARTTATASPKSPARSEVDPR
jgi:1-acyl-sn-glycerol-3-phosphate acyltransferase